MYLCGKAIHVSRREDKAFKQVLGAPPADTVAVWLKFDSTSTFWVDSRQSEVTAVGDMRINR
jgi:hypothetical protein